MKAEDGTSPLSSWMKAEDGTTSLSSWMKVEDGTTSLSSWMKDEDGTTSDAGHPTIIPMYTRAYAIGPKVNAFLHASPFHSYETWLLPNAKTLHVLRNQGDDHGDARGIRQVHTEADQEVPQVESPRSYSGRTSGRS